MSAKYSINFIIPYFGKFPNYFQLFLNSCKCNKDIHWTIITDNHKDYLYPGNVQVIKKPFRSIQERIKKLFGSDVYIEHPYKLCDYRPAYGYIFDEYIKGYDFWGYCDTDVINGRIRHFITDEILGKYNKIFVLGHMTLIRNTSKNNLMFMRPYEGNEYYLKVFQSHRSENFDEEFRGKTNINTLFLDSGKNIFRSDGIIADVYAKSNHFKLGVGTKVEPLKKAFFLWDDGRLIRIMNLNHELVKKEYIYIHLQKRKMKVNFQDLRNVRRYKIIPNVFEKLEADEINNLQDFNRIRLRHFNNQYLRIRSKNLITKIKNFGKEKLWR